MGKRVFNPQYGAFGTHGFSYYHDQCFPNKQTLSLPGGRTPEDELEKHNKEEREKERLLTERAKLREMLRQVRRLYAQRHDYADYKVFHDTTLDDLTIKLPRNQSEMMHIYGMGETRFRNIGEPLLQVIKKYLADEERSNRKASYSQRANNTARQTTSLKTSTDDSEDNASNSDEEIVMGKTLTVDEIVNQAFAEAEAKGDIIIFDDD